MNRSNSCLAICLAIALGTASSASLAADGINYLIAVTQMKAANANDDALKGAAQQRELLKKKQQLRDQQKNLESQDRMGNFEIQRLMSQHNQSGRRSNVQKKHDDTSNATARKFGG